MGEQAYAAVREQFRHALLPPMSRDAVRVDRVMRRILAVLPDIQGAGGATGVAPHLQGTQWHATVVDHPMVNAFAVPNGKVVVFTGLLRLFPNDDELAMVMAH
jgi:Zn-dependent protease with chaperone function